MKILLINVDSKIPNLALMKVSAWHKNQGDKVFLDSCCDPDRVYISCIFSENRSRALGIAKMFNCEVEIGGYGVNDKQLPKKIEHMMPDYSLYSDSPSMGYTSRGCFRKCPFCIVWKKEGSIRDHASIGEFWNPDHPNLLLLDNNFLASPKWKENIHFLLEHQIPVSFCQGLDIRLVNEENAYWLNMVDSRSMYFGCKMYYFAFDDPGIEDQMRKGVAILESQGIKPFYLTFYMLCGYNTTHEKDMHRFKVLRELGAFPYVMKYNNRTDDSWLNEFRRWSHSKIYKVCDFEDFYPAVKKGLIKKERSFMRFSEYVNQNASEGGL